MYCIPTWTLWDMSYGVPALTADSEPSNPQNGAADPSNEAAQGAENGCPVRGSILGQLCLTPIREPSVGRLKVQGLGLIV